MRQKSGPVKEPVKKVVKDIRRATRRQFSAEEKIRIVLEGLRGEECIAELCRREGIVQNLYYHEKAEIIRLVGQSALPVKRTLEKLGIPRATFYRWYDLYQSGGPEALDDRSPRPDRFWNRIPDDIREGIVQLALDEPALSPRELAVRFSDTKKCFVSEASVYLAVAAEITPDQ